METVVVNAANVDLKKNLVNGERQLRRLRELILRLELHNKRRSPTRARGHSPCTPSSCQPGSPGPPEHRVEYLQQQGQYEPLVLDDVELLDLELIGFSDHETWLYVPPKTNKKNCENYLTPLQWCRHILEAPEMKLARHDTRLQLQIASCWRKLLYSPRPTSTPPAVSRVAVVSPIGTSRTTCSSPRTPEMHASSRPHSQNPSGRVRTPTFIPHPTRGSSQQCRSLLPQVDRDVIFPGVDEDDLVPHGYKLQDLTDVQVIARLQEEKLRRDYASASTSQANRHSQSDTLTLSARPGPEEEDEAAGEDCGPPKRRLCPMLHPHTSSAQDWQSSSFLSIHPSVPPHPFAGRLQAPFRPGAEKTRHSLPNLSRAHSVPIAYLLHTSQSFDSPSCSTFLQPSIQSMRSISSPSQQPRKATAYLSPSIKDALTSRLPGSVGKSRIPTLSKCFSPSVSSLSPPWPAHFDDTASPFPTCKVPQPGDTYRNMMRLFSM
ncbi:SLAIN motif-containing protein 1-like isoform X1 [Hippocampus zosterae]|uniref:SLAIN motif-containing protein 1-like isoform X1 n=1 Tax=Hippocampus zosterae TaxID=109293 RepID=UPI00223E74DD|nr:SLAIN motif-containing protein 1-like isoform X1 [Hippocampus zosterae]